MRAARRTLLKGLPLLPFAGLFATGAGRADSGAPAVRLVADTNLPGIGPLAAAARRRGHAVSDPAGEIVAHVLGKGAGWLRAEGAILGLTGYSDMVLMRDLARPAGRRLRFAAPLDGTHPLVAGPLDRSEAALVSALQTGATRPARASIFIWIV